ncbi:MAG: serine O-acetyltransferase [Azospirillum sp.]|nr:serine O-acetyltransferase [Azospirillum sp.]
MDDQRHRPSSAEEAAAGEAAAILGAEPEPCGKRVWHDLLAEARQIAETEPHLLRFLDRYILRHNNFIDALTAVLAAKLADPIVEEHAIRRQIRDALGDDPTIADFALCDLHATCERDPAAAGPVAPFLYFKGFQGLQSHRVAHWLWQHGRRHTALYLQSRVSQIFAMDIHPAARIGRGVLVDHATGLVIGETAVVGDAVSILQEVTLGGTGKECGDRHPKVHAGVLIGAGAKLLGNIEIGICAKIGAGSVVLKNVPAHATVAGIPARVVGWGRSAPALSMDHSLPGRRAAAESPRG